MAKGKYEVIRPWVGVHLGQIIEMDEVHPSLRSHVKKVVSEKADDSAEAESLLDLARQEAEELRRNTEAELSQKIAEVLETAKVDAQGIKDAASAEAARIIDAAKAEAEAILAAANAAKASTPTPATPAAGKEGKGTGSKDSAAK